MALTDPTPIEHPRAVVTRSFVIAIIAFLTLIDLFGAQALVPSLGAAYGASPAEIGIAVNASTLGMALAGLVVAIFAQRINARVGIWVSLTGLTVPTALLGVTTDLTTFAALRVVQGIFMATAFTLTLSHLSSVCTRTAARGAMAAYITGNVASNFFGRLLASEVASTFGLPETFYVLAALNLSGGALAYFYFGGGLSRELQAHIGQPMPDRFAVLRQPELLASFAIGFMVLFAFIGVFTYVNFVLVRPPFEIGQATLGIVYAVFVPSILTTPLASVAATRFGTRSAFRLGMAVAIVGTLALLSANLGVLLVGLALVGMGLFFAQAVVTGFVGHAAGAAAATANGLYLTAYYVGGLFGAAILGEVFVAYGWFVTVAVIAVVSAVALGLGVWLHDREDDRTANGSG